MQESRVVSLAPSITQIVSELGVDPVGVSDFCDAKQEALRLGGLTNPNLEAIVKLKPDYVFLLANNAGLDRKLAEFNIQTYSFSNNSVSEVVDSIRKIGKLTNRVSESESLIDKLNIKKYKLNKSRKVALIISGDYDRLSGLVAAGKNSIYGEILDKVGAENVFTNSYPATSFESILLSKPDKIIFFKNPNQEFNRVNLKHKFKEISVDVFEDSSLLVPGLNVGEISRQLYEALK